MSDKWCDCKVIVSRDHVSYLESFLQRFSFLSFSLYIKPRSRKAEIRIFLPPLKRKGFLEKFQQALDVLDAALDTGNQSLISVNIRSEDEYRDEWKRFFKPLKIGCFIICPSWIKKNEGKGMSVIKLDPGMAFGTGHHYTTKYCIQMIQKYGKRAENFLDAGCGSGILSIVAARCLVKNITGVDNSRGAAKISKDNFQKNCGQKKALFKKMRLENLSSLKKYDVIAANLYDKIIIDHSSFLDKLLNKGGIIILSGIRHSYADRVEKAFQKYQKLDRGFDKEKEWAGFVFKKRSK